MGESVSSLRARLKSSLLDDAVENDKIKRGLDAQTTHTKGQRISER